MYGVQQRIVIDYKKYPFLADPIELSKKRYGVTDLSLLAKAREDLVELSEKRLERALSKGSLKGFSLDTVEEEVLSFAFSACAAVLTENKWVLSRYALAEAERAYEYMEKEEPEVLESLAVVLGANVKYVRERPYREPIAAVGASVVYAVYEFAIPFPLYVEYARRLILDPSWSPVNLPVLRGYVYLRREHVARLLKELVYGYVEAKAKQIVERCDVNALRDSLKPLLDRARQVMEKLLRRYEARGAEAREELLAFQPGTIVEDAFPPCIKEIYRRARMGEHLSHHERFALATFLLNLGMDIDAVVDVFRSLPDFNERVARYQVEHLAGLRGSMKKYRTYGCEKMKLLGLCRAECGVRSPIAAYYKNLRQSRPKSREESQRKTT